MFTCIYEYRIRFIKKIICCHVFELFDDFAIQKHKRIPKSEFLKPEISSVFFSESESTVVNWPFKSINLHRVTTSAVTQMADFMVVKIVHSFFFYKIKYNPLIEVGPCVKRGDSILDIGTGTPRTPIETRLVENSSLYFRRFYSDKYYNAFLMVSIISSVRLWNIMSSINFDLFWKYYIHRLSVHKNDHVRWCVAVSYRGVILCILCGISGIAHCAHTILLNER